jgi:alkanesulfonate monooxygenase SsuD/methylene tetrahydromethanopterin reductase-like flavin-dependent oxidoreductase (luciferase family)
MSARGPVSFGISVTPAAPEYPEIVAQVQAAERGGLELVGIQDHPYQRRFFDTFVLIGDLLARTTRLRFFPDVANLPLRHPAMLAKTAASLDITSGGRFELGIGAGSYWDGVAGMGGPRRTPGEAIASLEEAMRLIRAALDLERVVRGTGPHYPVSGYPPGPAPVHRVELWVGAYRPRALRLIGRLGDGWVPSLGYIGADGFREGAARIDDAAREAGRDPATIRRILNVGGAITEAPGRGAPLIGPPDLWIETLTTWALDLGVDAFIFWPPDSSVTHIERFAADVVPAVREAVARVRI